MAAENSPSPGAEVFQQPRSPRVYVEIGVGSECGYDTRFPFDPNDHYVGIENGAAYAYDQILASPPLEELESVKAHIDHAFAHPPRLFFVRGDGAHTPFRDGSVDEVLFTNVFSDPILAPTVPPSAAADRELLRDSAGVPYVEKDHFLADELGDGRKALLAEAARIVKIGGNVVINSYVTPKFVRHEQLAAWLTRHGFGVQLLAPHVTGWEEIRAPYRRVRNDSPASRFIRATKLK